MKKKQRGVRFKQSRAVCISNLQLLSIIVRYELGLVCLQCVCYRVFFIFLSPVLELRFVVYSCVCERLCECVCIVDTQSCLAPSF